MKTTCTIITICIILFALLFLAIDWMTRYAYDRKSPSLPKPLIRIIMGKTHANNKMLVSRFNTDEIQDVYITNIKKIKNLSICLLLVAIICGGVGFYSYANEINLTEPEDNHKYIVVSINENDIEYVCNDCGETVVISKSDVKHMWNVAYVNKPPQPTDVNDSSFLDLNNDNIINAKDYAMLKAN